MIKKNKYITTSISQWPAIRVKDEKTLIKIYLQNNNCPTYFKSIETCLIRNYNEISCEASKNIRRLIMG